MKEPAILIMKNHSCGSGFQAAKIRGKMLLATLTAVQLWIYFIMRIAVKEQSG